MLWGVQSSYGLRVASIKILRWEGKVEDRKLYLFVFILFLMVFTMVHIDHHKPILNTSSKPKLKTSISTLESINKESPEKTKQITNAWVKTPAQLPLHAEKVKTSKVPEQIVDSYLDYDNPQRGSIKQFSTLGENTEDVIISVYK